ncbi:MAG TPA: 5-formyltetrahydrofolate cyclo-ligase [Leucothrix mucor]|nr:5-formyltetrahydrofolate cyclo-ligase [Leucothrix mucor]
MTNQTDKIRSQLQQQRERLTTSQQLLLSQQICQQISDSAIFQAAQHIAFYTPVKSEASPLPLRKNSQKSFYLPLLSTQQYHHLFFVKIDGTTQYENNIYNIPEPLYTQADIIATENLDLVIMPLVAADKKGNRVGMGGGYYDRSFAFKQKLPISSKPILMGFAYDFQLVNNLMTEKWDVPLDYLATNKELIDFT